MDKDKKFLDFIVAIILFALGAYVLGYSIFITVKTNSKIMTSPGFLPGILGGSLMFCSVLLLFGSLKDVGLAKTLEQIKDWWINDILRSKQTRNTLFGMVLMGVYSCVLMVFMPYWAATLIMLLFLFWYLHATTPIKSVIIAVLAVAAIVGVFQNLFHVRLP